MDAMAEKLKFKNYSPYPVRSPRLIIRKPFKFEESDEELEPEKPERELYQPKIERCSHAELIKRRTRNFEY